MVKSRFTKMKITGLNCLVPDYPHCIDEDIGFFGGDPQKLAKAKKLIGFGHRYNAPPGCTPTDLCRAAIDRLAADVSLDLGTVDALICVVQAPDYPQPGSSFILHKKCGFPTTCASLDINQGCPGYVYGLWLAGALLESGACRKIVLATGNFNGPSQTPRSHLLFGDAASATLLEYDEGATASFFNLGADGSGYEAIIIPAGGARLPLDHQILDLVITERTGGQQQLTDKYVDGLEVFNFAIREAAPNMTELLEYAQCPADRVDFAAIHQANKQIVDLVAAKAGLREDQYSTRTFTEYGNLSSVSVPAVISHQLAEKIKNGPEKVLMSGYGIGTAWASCLMELAGVDCPGVVVDKFDCGPTPEEEKTYWVNKISGRLD